MRLLRVLRTVSCDADLKISETKVTDDDPSIGMVVFFTRTVGLVRYRGTCGSEATGSHAWWYFFTGCFSLSLGRVFIDYLVAKMVPRVSEPFRSGSLQGSQSRGSGRAVSYTSPHFACRVFFRHRRLIHSNVTIGRVKVFVLQLI